MKAPRGALLTRLGERTCAWSERWFPDAFAFAPLALVLLGALGATLSYQPPVMPP